MLPVLRHCARFVLLGPPCCGKGTLGPRIAQRLAIPHISTGEIFRSHLKEHSHFGEEIKHCMQEGKLVPDDLVTRITFDALSRTSRGFISDGYPRNVEQAKSLEKFGDVHVIHLEAEDDTIISRLTNRITCANCGLVFNRLFHPPKIENACDDCGGELTKRDDDTLEVALERINTYHRMTEPLVDWYRERSIVTTIHTGELSPDEIAHRVLEEIVRE